MTALLPVLAGANMIYGPGMLESGLVMSIGQLVSDAEMIRLVKQILAGMPVDEESMALDVIKKIGPGGNYMGHRHTSRLYKSLQSNPKISDRNVRSDWEKLGGEDMAARAMTEAKRILAEYHPQILDEQTSAKLRAIVEAADKEFGV